MLAILLPLTGYFIVKTASQKALQLPRHYYADSVITAVKKGKETTDTIWHQLPDFSLTNQQGHLVSLEDLKGKVIIADFFFTHCPTICPRLTLNMKRLQESITNAQRTGDKTNQYVHFLSFSIDPERDSVERLKMWADRFQVNPEKWWLLTGKKKDIYDLAIKEMKVGVEDGKGVDTNFFHTDYFVLIDTNRHVRGYYHGLDSVSLAKISEDIILLTMEKAPGGKGPLAGKFLLIAVVGLIAILGAGLLVFLIKRQK